MHFVVAGFTIEDRVPMEDSYMRQVGDLKIRCLPRIDSGNDSQLGRRAVDGTTVASPDVPVRKVAADTCLTCVHLPGRVFFI